MTRSQSPTQRNQTVRRSGARRRLCALVTIVLLAAACSSGESASSSRNGGGTVQDVPATTAPEDSGNSDNASDPDPSTAAASPTTAPAPATAAAEPDEPGEPDEPDEPGEPDDDNRVQSEPIDPASVVAESLEVTVLERFDHDSDAFTQGLEIVDGRMFESTGSPSAFYPNSTTSVREVDPNTGEVLRVRDFGQDYFGEGLAVVGDTLVQLSWRAQEAYVFDRESFELVGEFQYNTEGWGLCHDGTRFIMSDGTGTLYIRNTETFALESTVSVLRNGVPVTRLNELECVDGQVWSNIWYGNEILRIDPDNGAVTGVADLTRIARPFLAVHSENVLNGIAWDEETETFTITGKRWNEMLRVDFEPGA